MRRDAALLLVLLLMPPATAVTIGTSQPFASTRSDAVHWSVATTTEVNDLSVNATAIALDGTWLDFAPASSTAYVMIQRWSADTREYRISTDASTSLSFTFTNPGLSWQTTLNGAVHSTCGTTSPTCTHTLGTATSWTVIVGQPTMGGGGAGGIPPPASPPAVETGAAPAQTGGTQAGGTTDEVDRLPDPFPPLADPADLFPRLSAGQWLGILVSLVFIASGTPIATRLPIPIRLPGALALPLGVVLLTLIYLTAGA